jgi:hypothetical protein
LATGHALITMYDRIFLLSGSFFPALNALLIGSLLYQSRLVPPPAWTTVPWPRQRLLANVSHLDK